LILSVNAGIFCSMANCAAGAGNCDAVAGYTQCYSCQPGYYSVGGYNAACTQCPAGQYNPSSGQSSCTSCPAGYYCPVNSSFPIHVPDGSYSLLGQSNYSLCPENKYVKCSWNHIDARRFEAYNCSQGASTPITCPGGSTSPAGSNGCTYTNPQYQGYIIGVRESGGDYVDLPSTASQFCKINGWSGSQCMSGCPVVNGWSNYITSCNCPANGNVYSCSACTITYNSIRLTNMYSYKSLTSVWSLYGSSDRTGQPTPYAYYQITSVKCH